MRELKRRTPNAERSTSNSQCRTQTSRAGSEIFQQLSNLVVSPKICECQAAALGAENKAKVKSDSTLEIMLMEATNSRTRMNMRLAEALAHRINCSSYFASAGSGKFANGPTKRFREINLQDQPRDCRCNVSSCPPFARA